MFKKRIINVVIALALLAGVVSGTGIFADELGLSVTQQAHACSGGSGGGDC